MGLPKSLIHVQQLGGNPVPIWISRRGLIYIHIYIFKIQSLLQVCENRKSLFEEIFITKWTNVLDNN